MTRPAWLPWLIAGWLVLVHMFVIGLPIALAARRAFASR